MNYIDGCRFCSDSRLNDNKILNLPNEETILFENENIYVKVDISPLCIGHILIITNDHYLNFFEVPNKIKKDIIKIKEKITSVYKEVYNTDVLFFEHGSAIEGDAGSSIDHAHLHCIPYKFSINEEVNKLLKNSVECDIFLSEFNNEFSYIYLESIKDGKKLYKVNKLPSQFLRKVIANNFNNKEYKWQTECQKKESINNLNKTIEDLRNKISI